MWMKDKQTLALVTRAVKNDAKAFATLCERKVREVTYLCMMELGNVEDAQDASQEVFLRMQRGIAALRNPEGFNVWLNRIVVTVCHGMRRKKMRTPQLSFEDEFEDENFADTLNELPIEAVERGETRQVIEDLVRQLPEKYRMCVLLHYYQKLSYAEVAKTLGISTAAVTSNLRIARKHLKEGLQRELGVDFGSVSAVPGLAIGPGLAIIFENQAKAAITPQIAKACLSGVAASIGKQSAASTVVLQRAATVLFAATIGVMSVFAAFRGFLPQNSFGPGTPRGYAEASNMQDGLRETASAENSAAEPALRSGRVGLYNAEGSPIPLPGGAQVFLLDPDQQIVAAAPLAEDGSYCFENVEITRAGVYTVRAVNAEGDPILGIEDLKVYLSE
jgi:RNA polymerase sigma-70 factor (ECF subfamily)